MGTKVHNSPQTTQRFIMKINALICDALHTYLRRPSHLSASAVALICVI